MAFSEADLANEVKKIILQKLDAGQAVRKTWLIIEARKLHQAAEGPDAEYYGLCADLKTADAVRRALNELKREGDEAAEGADVLPGFIHLQRSYLVERADEPIAVPVHLMSDDEIEAKASMHEKMSASHLAHADELRRFMASRVSSEVAAE